MVHALHDIPGLDLEQGVPVGAVDKGVIALAALVGHAGQVGVPLLAVLAHHCAVVVGVCGQEVLRVVVAVHDDLAQGIMDVGIVAAYSNTDSCISLQGSAGGEGVSDVDVHQVTELFSSRVFECQQMNPSNIAILATGMRPNPVLPRQRMIQSCSCNIVPW